MRFARTSLAVDSDPVFLRRIAQDLLSNAIKYTEFGGVLVGVQKRGTRTWLEVRDTGMGIPVADRERIFDEFHRLGRDGRGESGMGIGLSIVKRPCAKFDHPISLESSPGRSKVFRIGLTVVTSPIPAGPGRLLPLPDRDRLRGRTVLIVEDNDSMRHG